jgi:hypoxanthine phosphoribosyltransferase
MKQTYISFDQYKGHVAELCRQITNSNWRPDYIVGITRGGLLPAKMISHYFGITCHTLNVSLRDSEDIGPESNLWMAEDAFGYNMDTPKNILIVDDMNDSGATLNWIKSDWRSGCLPGDAKWDNVWGNNVKVAVIVNNTTSDYKDPDYVAMEVNKAEDPQWIVFPYEEWWK